MKVDLHTHTNLSQDAEATFEGYLAHAEKTGLDMFCVTEHIDFNPLDWGYGFYDPIRYFAKVNELRSAYTGPVKLLAGLEFSEPHMYPEQFASVTGSYPYDFIIGSIHWANDYFPLYQNSLPAQEYFSYYWDEVLALSKCSGYDSLGHIDFPKRYYKELWYEESTVREIFKNIIENEISLEINTSGLRKGLTETIPGRELLEMYISEGGRYVTLGSDSHYDTDLGADIETAKALVRELHLQEVVYINRKKIEIA